MIKFLKKKFGARYIENDLQRYQSIMQLIRIREKELQSKTDAELKEISRNLKNHPAGNKDPENLLIEAYALVCEAAYRILNMRPFDVQILGALAMNEGKVIEMNTGEGKTLVATMPAYLNALTGKGVHILTFNDYLAKRDAQWMGKVYEYLGVQVGFIKDGLTPDERKTVYQSDIIYMTAKQGGFDYLRSALARDSEDIILPPTGFAIVDEVDSILIDEARTPLVIAGRRPENNTIDLYEISRVINELEKGQDYQMNEYELNAFLTGKGISKIEERLNCQNLYDPENEELLYRANQALHANYLLHKDIDYIVRNDKIELVDEFTGRVIEDRKWPHGLQAAIEAKEHIPILEEGNILGKTTLQHFIKRYDKICGMTGTATPSAEEFYEMYDVPVVVIPPNKKSIRKDREDIIFWDKESKYKALIKEVKKEHGRSRPILVGTSSVEESEVISKLLIKESIKCETLNARNDEEEAKIVATAGLLGAVTISTNMAGRGTDIKLGGEQGVDKERIEELGGLYVIGTNRFESRRIDNQLRGRSGRQGDPGESRFFISIEDHLLVRHGINELIPKRFRKKKSISEANNQIIRREINRTQRIVEGKNLDIRKTLIKYASFVETQRQIIVQRRNEILNDQADSLLMEKHPDLYKKLEDLHGRGLLELAERQVSLAVIDKNWTDYLEEIENVREGIHWVTRAGLNPYYEFQKTSSEMFTSLLNKIDEQILGILKRVSINKNGVDLEKEGLKPPSTTWTYLISDNPFGDRLEIMLGGNVGYAAFAALVNWPLLILYFTFRKLFKKRKQD